MDFSPAAGLEPTWSPFSRRDFSCEIILRVAILDWVWMMGLAVVIATGDKTPAGFSGQSRSVVRAELWLVAGFDVKLNFCGQDFYFVMI